MKFIFIIAEAVFLLSLVNMLYIVLYIIMSFSDEEKTYGVLCMDGMILK